MRPRYGRLALIAFGGTLAFESIFLIADRDGKVTRYLAVEAPTWLRALHAFRPQALGVRLSNLLGYRFDVAGYHAPWQFWVVSWAVDLLLTALGVWLILLLYRAWRSDRRGVVAEGR